MTRPKLQSHLENKLSVKAVLREFDMNEPEPFPGANKMVQETLKENFEIGEISSCFDIESLDKIITEFYQENNYSFQGFLQNPTFDYQQAERLNIKRRDYTFQNTENDLIIVSISLTPTRTLLASVHYNS